MPDRYIHFLYFGCSGIYHRDLHGEDHKNPVNLCGTPHCFAGWFGVAIYEHLRPDFTNDFTNDKETLGYTSASNKMALMLCGVDKDSALEQWARDNPEIWGNEYGYYVFLHNIAFGFTDNTPNKMYWIIRKLREVGERLQKIEQQNKRD